MEVVLIATPTRNSGNIKSLREAIARRGWTLKEIEAKDLSFEVKTDGLRVLYKGNEFRPNAVIYRMVGRFLPLLAPILDHWISQGVCVINSPEATMAAWSKMLSSIAFAKAGVPFVETVFVYPHRLEGELEDESAYVIKPIFGTQGHYMGFQKSKEDVENYLASTYFDSEGRLTVPPLMVQKDLGIDVKEIRAQVIGGKCVALMRRIPPKDQRFSDNLAGGTNEVLPLSHPAVAIAEKAAQVLNLDFAGIDLFETEEGCLVSEANGSPGWVGLEVVSGVSVSDALFDLIWERVPEDVKAKSLISSAEKKLLAIQEAKAFAVTSANTPADAPSLEKVVVNKVIASQVISNEVVVRKPGFLSRLMGSRA